WRRAEKRQPIPPISEYGRPRSGKVTDNRCPAAAGSAEEQGSLGSAYDHVQGGTRLTAECAAALPPYAPVAPGIRCPLPATQRLAVQATSPRFLRQRYLERWAE